jgi:type I restriction enzyme S subunit
MIKLSDVLIKTSNIRWDAFKNTDTFHYIDLSSVDRTMHKITQTSYINCTNAPSRAKKIVYEGDVLFGTTRPTLNRLCVIEEEYDNQICSTGLCVLRADTTRIIPKYIYYLLTTREFYSYIESLQRGASYPAVTDKDVKNYNFELPTIEQQKKKIAKLDMAFEKINLSIKLTFTREQKLKALKRAMLEETLYENEAE